MIVPRATFVYVSMITAFMGGLWVILSFGSTLRTPVDLAGKWELSSSNGTEEMTLEQSGRFINLTSPRFTGNLKFDSTAADATTIRLRGSGALLTFEGLGLEDTCTIQFDGPMAGTYKARRILRAYPKSVLPATKPAAAGVSTTTPVSH